MVVLHVGLLPPRRRHAGHAASRGDEPAAGWQLVAGAQRGPRAALRGGSQQPRGHGYHERHRHGRGDGHRGPILRGGRPAHHVRRHHLGRGHVGDLQGGLPHGNEPQLRHDGAAYGGQLDPSAIAGGAFSQHRDCYQPPFHGLHAGDGLRLGLRYQYGHTGHPEQAGRERMPAVRVVLGHVHLCTRHAHGACDQQGGAERLAPGCELVANVLRGSTVRKCHPRRQRALVGLHEHVHRRRRLHNGVPLRQGLAARHLERGVDVGR
mmetsp:Transcript_5958/g.19243  ORF Transcript_5958/g.19243 Transcript_5958/m.19243 type:complete len:264 (-) Transcript_5958:357-1148(-)